MQKVNGKDKVFAGTCTGKNNPTNGEQIVCALRKPTAMQLKAILNANDLYLALAADAGESMGRIESALFASEE